MCGSSQAADAARSTTRDTLKLWGQKGHSGQNGRIPAERRTSSSRRARQDRTGWAMPGEDTPSPPRLRQRRPMILQMCALQNPEVSYGAFPARPRPPWKCRSAVRDGADRVPSPRDTPSHRASPRPGSHCAPAGDSWAPIRLSPGAPRRGRGNAVTAPRRGGAVAAPLFGQNHPNWSARKGSPPTDAPRRTGTAAVGRSRVIRPELSRCPHYGAVFGPSGVPGLCITVPSHEPRQ